MKKIFSYSILFILVVILVSIICSGCSNNISTEDHPNEDRFVVIEKGLTYSVCYDKYTNVVYLYNRGGLFPIYNSDGSLYLYGTPKCVG